MEEEERAAQSAKLQELIRRGGPEDLQEANRLMKIMAGYDTRSKTDYRAKAAEEVGKIQRKARLLEERLEAFKPGDKMQEGDVYEELASSLMSAQPKIQKMCEEESDDHEAVAKLFEINDSIHRTVERYRLLKKGDIEGASKIEKGTLGTSVGVSKDANNELSLIDFEEPAPAPEQSAQTSSQAEPSKAVGGIDDDLLGLRLGGVSLQPQASPAPAQSAAGQSSAGNGLADDLLGLQISGSSMPSHGEAGGISLGSGPQRFQTPPVRNKVNNVMSAFGSPAPHPQQPSYVQQQQQQYQQQQQQEYQQHMQQQAPKPSTSQPVAPEARKPDPFASLLD